MTETDDNYLSGLAHSPGTLAVTETARSAAQVTPPKTVILIADDDEDVREYIEHFLQKAGYATVSASDGAEVFDLLESSTPELFLLDCNMPKLDGFTVCKRLKKDPRYQDSPVVFLTALSSPKDKARGFEAGGADYVTKPLEKTELLARIRNHLDLAKSRYLAKRKAMLLETIANEQGGRLEQVRTGQESLLTQVSSFQELNLAVRFHPAHEAGGDFYEVSKLSDHSIGLFVADVSGHDLSVPYITGALKALTATFLNESLAPHETLMMLNAGLEKFLREERYVTACYAKFSRYLMEVELANAAHPPALHQTVDGKLNFIELVGDVLGMYDAVSFDLRRLTVQPGERLYLYTDGLIECYPNPGGSPGSRTHGMEKFSDSIRARSGCPLAEVVDSTVNELLQICGGSAEDDIVLLGMEF